MKAAHVPTTSNMRQADYQIDPVFLNRWSPRAMSGDEISQDELLSLFEAGRWAPSSYNNQPWRFIYARKNTPAWNLFLDFLVEQNRVWAKNAAALIVFISKTTFDYNGQPSITHTFDAGAAWENLALQGSINGLVVHGMQGFDYERAKKALEIPDGYTVEAMAAVGRPGKLEDLPDKLREKEFPSGRKKLSEIAFEGKFKTP